MQTIKHKTTGETQNVESLQGYDAAEWDKVGNIPKTAAGDLSLFVGGVEDAAAVEGALIAQIKREAETEKMRSMTPGGAKKTEYADKAAEVRSAQGLLGGGLSLIAALNLLTPQQRALMFPYAIADAAEHGDTLDKALGRFATGMMSAGTVPVLAAREQGLTKRVKEAKTAADKRAVFASRKWT